MSIHRTLPGRGGIVRGRAPDRIGWSGASLLTVPVALVAVLLLAIPSGAVPAPPVGALGTLTTTCNPKNPSPSALDIPGANVAHAAVGDLLNVSFEYRVVNYSKADKGIHLDFPSVVAVFPLQPSGSHQVFLVPSTSTVGGSKWSDAMDHSVSSKVLTSLTFDRNASAYLSTAKIAVMATTPTGSLTLEVRWHWTVFHVKNGNRATGAWTTPSLNASAPFLPSTFFPAAYVGIASTSGASIPSNTTYVVGLNGSVSSTWFRMVFEYPNNGTEIQSIYEYTTANLTLFNATLPAAFTNGTGVPAGPYLIHVHDSCQAIVHVLKVTVT